MSDCRLGVVALGDSITNGGGELQWGVALQSWAMWAARGLALPYTGHAVDGARIRDVVREQVPRLDHRRYDLGCLYAGVNDVRAPDWDPDAFAAGYAIALTALAERCDRLLTVTIPLDLGRPRAGARVEEANRIIEAAADDALVLDLRAFGARNLVMTDHVHPTAFGQVWIAERALEVVGMDVRVRPSSLIAPGSRTRRRALQGDWTYAYRRLKVAARELRHAAAARRAA